MDKEKFKILDEIEDKLLEWVNDSTLDDIDQVEEIKDMLTEAQGKLTDFMDSIRHKYDEQMNSENKYFDNEVLRGYIYTDGYHGGAYTFKGSVENISSFIMFADNHDVVITDMSDNFILNTKGVVVDSVFSQEFNILLLDKLIKMKYNEIEPIKIEFIEEGVILEKEMIQHIL